MIANSGKATRSAWDSRACSRYCMILAVLPFMSPTVGFIWARARRNMRVMITSTVLELRSL